ncbi:disintegrin and metalloproteinase domain-containing protein 15 [Ornithorhynchus anatinus]|uniref:disintegrin and metalloproteinase domain-containing protein 15 n=1 Tax=Ornithorhynchus anatinus TaxID=9258 RepID=UPI0019D41F9C|nr:disintegrin and metalloproteinase domain-containing protein 15 [Ornithorhynchus anatinus]
MRLALLWTLGLLGAGSPPSAAAHPGGRRPERTPPGHATPLVLRGNGTVSLKDALRDGPPSALRIALDLAGLERVLDLRRNEVLLPRPPSPTWPRPAGPRHPRAGDALENCCYHGTVLGLPDSRVSVCTCSGLRGLVALTPGVSLALEPTAGGPDGPVRVTGTDDLRLPGGSCATRPPPPGPRPARRVRGGPAWWVGPGSRGVPHRAAPSPQGQTGRGGAGGEPRLVELVIVADPSEVRRYPDAQELQTRMLEVANLVDAFFLPLGVRVALVGIEAWTPGAGATLSRDPGAALDRFLRWRRTDLLPRLPHDSAQLVTASLFSGAAVGMAVHDSICSPEFSGGVNVDHSVSVLGLASTMAHELGHSLGLPHDPPGEACPCPDRPPAKSCIMEAATAFLPGLSFSTCSREALERGLRAGGKACLFARGDPRPARTPRTPRCGNLLVEPGERCDCGLRQDCSDPCCNATSCQLMPGAQCSSDQLCCRDCRFRPAGWECRPRRGACDLPESCPGDGPRCPPDASLGDGEPCGTGAGEEAVCAGGRCASYAAQCRALWGPGASPAPGPCLLAANVRGDAFGSCGRRADGGYRPCAPRDAGCGQLQCRGGGARPLVGTARETRTETVAANGTRRACRWTHLDLGEDVAQPPLALTGTSCGPGLVCVERRCQPVETLKAEECRSKCHGRGVCNSRGHCHCQEGWAPPNCETHGTGGSVDSGALGQPKAARSLTAGLLLSLTLLLLLLVALGVWYKHRLRRRSLRRGPGRLKGTGGLDSEAAETRVRFLHGSFWANGWGGPQTSLPRRSRATELQSLSGAKIRSNRRIRKTGIGSGSPPWDGDRVHPRLPGRARGSGPRQAPRPPEALAHRPLRPRAPRRYRSGRDGALQAGAPAPQLYRDRHRRSPLTPPSSRVGPGPGPGDPRRRRGRRRSAAEGRRASRRAGRGPRGAVGPPAALWGTRVGAGGPAAHA